MARRFNQSSPKINRTPLQGLNVLYMAVNIVQNFKKIWIIHLFKSITLSNKGFKILRMRQQ